MLNKTIFYKNCRFLLISYFILSCHFIKSNVEPIQKDYLSLLWIKAVLKDNISYPQELSVTRKKEAMLLFEKALSFKKNRDFEKSITLFEDSIDLDINAEVYYEYAIVLSNTKRFYNAIKANEISIELDYKRPELALYNIACSYSLLNDEYNTYAYLEKAIKKGYNAFEYMERDPDLRNIREQNPRKWKQKIYTFSKPEKDISESDILGLIGAGKPRPASYYFLCKNGTVLRNDFEPWSCGQGYDKGYWKIEANQIEFSWDESCKPLGKKPYPYIQTDHCQFTEYQFQSCQKISKLHPQAHRKSISKFEDYQIKSLFSNDMVSWGLWHGKTMPEPPQCNPNFIPKNLDDLNVFKR